VQYKLGKIKRVTLPALAGDSPGQVMNVLLVGSDSRDNLQGEAAAQAGKGEVSGQRSDTIMILHIDPRQQKAAIVSVPRDLYVPIAGTTYSDRVNTAFAVGGPDKLVATVQQALGVTINHYVEVDFVGFKGIVDTVGGVTEYVPYPARDAFSGLDVPKAGCIQLDGTQGLAWVRSRSIQFLVNGTWEEDPRADLGRIERQQDFIRRMMKKAVSTGLTNPLQLNRLIDVGVKDVTLDGTLSTKDMTTLGRRFSSLDPDRVALATLPTTPADVGGASVLKLQTAGARALIDLVNGKAPPASTTVPAQPGTSGAPSPAGKVGPADVRVQVLNGVGTAGAAAKAATGLTALGFPVADKGDAPASAKTTIHYASGQVAKAQVVQKALLGPSVLQEDPTTKAVDVSLVLGADYTGLKGGPIAPVSLPAAATTTTSALPQLSPVPLPKGTTAPPC
jgi:LCP family protein required for cell wall assembly